MYPNPADIKKHRFNLSVNDDMRRDFEEEAQLMQMQPTSAITQLALDGLAWRRHQRNSSGSAASLRHAVA